MRRLLLPFLALVAIVATSCGSVDSPAAKVGSDKITSDSLKVELEQIKGNAAYRKALEESYGTSLAGTAKGTFDTAFVAQVLSLRVYYQLLERELGRRKAAISSADLKSASDAVTQQFDSLGKNVLKTFSQDERDRIVHQQALVEVAQREITAEVSDPQVYFQQHAGEFAQACVSHILVDTKTRTMAQAKQKAASLKAKIDAGTPLADLAATESDDTGSAAQGGDLGCASLSTYVPEFAQAAAKAPIDKVTGPVQSSFGYHLILVKSRTATSYADAAQQVQSKLADLQGSALDDFLAKVTCDAKTKIVIDPKYGTWDRSACAAHGIGKIVPPKGSAKPTTTTTAPAATPAG